MYTPINPNFTILKWVEGGLHYTDIISVRYEEVAILLQNVQQESSSIRIQVLQKSQ